MSQALVEQKQKERKFLEQLLDGKKVENYTIPVPVKAELRKYQQVCQCSTCRRVAIPSIMIINATAIKQRFRVQCLYLRWLAVQCGALRLYGTD